MQGHQYDGCLQTALFLLSLFIRLEETRTKIQHGRHDRVELLGFGKLFIRFINDKAVTDASLATAKMVKGLIPAFRPAFTLLQNGTRVYSLLSDKIEIVKYDENEKKKKNSGTTDGGDQPSGGGSGSTTEGGEATFE